MTDANTPTGRTADDAPEPSGADLARIALNQARQAAKKRGASEARAPRRQHARTVRRDGREPSGFAAVLRGLMADRAWELPAAGGTVLERWPDIAASLSPQLPHHVQAVAFHPETGQLDLRPDSPAYATQLRLISARIVAAVNECAGTGVVRTVRVLPAGTGTAGPPTRPASPAQAPAAPEAPVKTRQMASDGFHQAITAHRATWSEAQRRPSPEVQAAIERQIREQAREPEEAFVDGRQAVEELRAKAAAQQQIRPSDASRARALQRLAAERTGLATITPAAAPGHLGRTA
ncbi:DciA family protein [Streptomyces cyaneofuscatus]